MLNIALEVRSFHNNIMTKFEEPGTSVKEQKVYGLIIVQLTRLKKFNVQNTYLILLLLIAARFYLPGYGS